jgi:hypothetical protein
MGARSMAHAREPGIKFFSNAREPIAKFNSRQEKNRPNYFLLFMRRKCTARAFDTE